MECNATIHYLLFFYDNKCVVILRFHINTSILYYNVAELHYIRNLSAVYMTPTFNVIQSTDDVIDKVVQTGAIHGVNERCI